MRLIQMDDFKVEKPKTGPAPMLQWIEIDKLVVDDRYQRELKLENVRTIKRIAENFDWAKFLCVHVAPVEGGFFAIIDGQHRTHAALACGIEKVPCMVVHMTLQQQAASFAAINGMSTKVTPFHIYKAALAANEIWATGVRDAVSASDCTLMTFNRSETEKKPGEVYCLRFVRNVFERYGHDAFVRCLKLIRRTEGMGTESETFAHSLLRPLMQAILSRPHALAKEKELEAFLELFDVWQADEKAGKIIAERRRKGFPSITKMELMETLIGDAIDVALPVRMTLPSTPLASQVNRRPNAA